MDGFGDDDDYWGAYDEVTDGYIEDASPAFQASNHPKQFWAGSYADITDVANSEVKPTAEMIAPWQNLMGEAHLCTGEDTCCDQNEPGTAPQEDVAFQFGSTCAAVARKGSEGSDESDYWGMYGAVQYAENMEKQQAFVEAPARVAITFQRWRSRPPSKQKQLPKADPSSSSTYGVLANAPQRSQEAFSVFMSPRRTEKGARMGRSPPPGMKKDECGSLSWAAASARRPEEASSKVSQCCEESSAAHRNLVPVDQSLQSNGSAEVLELPERTNLEWEITTAAADVDVEEEDRNELQASTTTRFRPCGSEADAKAAAAPRKNFLVTGSKFRTPSPPPWQAVKSLQKSIASEQNLLFVDITQVSV